MFWGVTQLPVSLTSLAHLAYAAFLINIKKLMKAHEFYILFLFSAFCET